jgi:predicted ester cyclase
VSLYRSNLAMKSESYEGQFFCVYRLCCHTLTVNHHSVYECRLKRHFMDVYPNFYSVNFSKIFLDP